MRPLLAAAALLLLCPTPAHATQGLLCRAVAGKAPRISLVIGAGGIAGASLDERGRWVSTSAEGDLRLAQAWIDREQVLVDLIIGPKWEQVARLRVRFDPPARGKPNSARGILTLRGRTHRVRCAEA